jgi:2-dehydro-3-deoxyphosphogluconate aldolase/(4S)-4-hydroxy-2-oxoglutarate aldolase
MRQSEHDDQSMTIDEVVQRIGEVGIIPVVRAASVAEASRAVEAICSGGVPIIEITMTVPDAVEVIRQVVHEYGDKVLTGAGTVLTSVQAKSCIDAGAEFLVSPGLSLPVLCTAQAMGKLAIPGVLTPTELMNAGLNGANVVKVFPCCNVGGPAYLKSLKGPFPNVSLIPTGGVNLSNAAEYIRAGAFALGVGADLVDLAALRAGNLDKIAGTARELLDAVRRARIGQQIMGNQ